VPDPGGGNVAHRHGIGAKGRQFVRM
jgi:hypothetical protein